MALYLEHFGLARAAVPHHAAHRFLLRRRRPRRDAGGADLRDPARRRHRQGVGRGRQRQDHAVPRADGAAAGSTSRPSTSPRPRSRATRSCTRSPTTSSSSSSRRARRSVALRELQEHLIAPLRRRPPRGGPDRRGARHARRHARADAAAVQPGVEPPQAAADRAVRPARARRHARQAGAAPAARPHHALVPHAAARRRPRWRSTSRSACAPPATAGPRSSRRARSRIVSRASGGLTRRINILADKALLAAFTENTHAITDRHVRAAIADSEFAAVARNRRPALYVARGAGAPAGRDRRAPSQWIATAPPPAASAVACAPQDRVAPRRQQSPRRPTPEPVAAARVRTAGRHPQRRRPAAAQRGAGAPARRLFGRRAAAARRAARGDARAARPRAATSTTRSSCSSPRTPTRRAWSASCCAPASWCRSRSSYVIPVAGGGDVPAVGGLRRVRQPRGSARRRPAPAAALPAGLPRRPAQLRRAPAVFVKPENAWRQAFSRIPQKFVLSLPQEGVSRA